MGLIRQKSGRTSYLTGGRGKVILLLHGIPGSSYSWLNTGEKMTENYQVIIPDLMGFGRSEVPAGDYYLRPQAKALKALLDDLEIKELYIAGHDFGGPVAITMMDMYPEIEIIGLVLSSTNVFTDTYVPPPLRLAKVPVLNSVVFSAMVGNRLGMWMLYLAATRNKTEATWSHFKNHLTSSGVDLSRKIFQRSLADLKGNYQAVEDILGKIEAPTLILWGDSDPFFSTDVGERIQTTMQNSEIRIYPATGHFVPEERPQEVARDIITFFDKHK